MYFFQSTPKESLQWFRLVQGTLKLRRLHLLRQKQQNPQQRRRLQIYWPQSHKHMQMDPSRSHCNLQQQVRVYTNIYYNLLTNYIIILRWITTPFDTTKNRLAYDIWSNSRAKCSCRWAYIQSILLTLLNSPSDLLPLTFDLTTPTHTQHATSPEDFNYVFQSPLTPSRPPGSITGHPAPKPQGRQLLQLHFITTMVACLLKLDHTEEGLDPHH